MHRLPAIPFERPMPESDELEDAGDSSTLPDRIKLGAVWLCVTVIGILALVYATVAQFSQAYTMAGLVGLLVVYAAYGSFLKRKNAVQFADSLYYMGFLWAVFALITTFMIWPVPKLTPDVVLTTFGYALVATFSGMLLRMVVIQFHGTLPDRLAYSQEAIDGHLAALSRQISDATMDITTFRQRAAAELGGTLHEVVRGLNDVRESLIEQQHSMTAAISERLESSLKEMLGRWNSMEIPHDMVAAETAKLVTTLGKRGHEVEAAVQQLEQCVRQAADTVTSLGESLCGSDAAKRIGVAVNGLSDTIHERTKEFAAMTSALEQSRAELEGQLRSMHSVRSACAGIATQLSTLESELRDVSAQSLGADVRNGLENVHKAIQSTLEASRAIETAMRGVKALLKGAEAEEHAVHGA